MKQALSLKARAIAYLSRREYSEYELRRKLSAWADSDEQLMSLLQDLQHAGWLSNERFARSLVRQRQPKKGTLLILQELKQHQISSELFDEIREDLLSTELERAVEVWRKKFYHLPQTPQEKLKQTRFLVARGFSSSVIRQVFLEIQSSFD